MNGNKNTSFTLNIVECCINTLGKLYFLHDICSEQKITKQNIIHMKRLLLFMLLSAPLLFTSCEVNEYGPDITTDYITVGARDWYSVGTYGQPGYTWEASYRADYITPNVIRNGAIMVYAVYDDSDIQLPDVFADWIGSSKFVQILGYKISAGRITFTIESSDFETTPYNYSREYKVVVVY